MDNAWLRVSYPAPHARVNQEHVPGAFEHTLRLLADCYRISREEYECAVQEEFFKSG